MASAAICSSATLTTEGSTPSIANTGRFQGTLRNKTGKAIANSGLWGLAFGNGVIGTPRTLLFSAGIDNYSHGLVGLIRPNSHG